MNTNPSQTASALINTHSRHGRVTVDDVNVFYREAGSPEKPTVLLLHGFPTSSHMYRHLLTALAGDYHLIAPDLPGFGFTESPSSKEFAYTFDHLAEVIGKFTDALGLKSYALYVFDYGAPVGFRLALKHPDRITALISQNGNAYVEGLSEGWNPIQTYWQEPSEKNRVALRAFLAPKSSARPSPPDIHPSLPGSLTECTSSPCNAMSSSSTGGLWSCCCSRRHFCRPQLSGASG